LHGKDEVEQSPETLRLLEEDSGSFNCSYTTSNFRGLYWYRQDPGKGPEFLFPLYSVGDKKDKDRLEPCYRKREALCTSSPLNLKSQRFTSVLWMHSAPQAPEPDVKTLQLGSGAQAEASLLLSSPKKYLFSAFYRLLCGE
jgi:hypothetical protein